MGIVAFQWGDKQLTLLQNREDLIKRKTEPVAWDEDNKILRGLPENSFGTWCGVSRRGRVAFLVDALLHDNLSPSMFRPVDFLRGEMSPMDFAKEWSADSKCAYIMNRGLAYHMIVADVNSNSMVYISKTSPGDSIVRTAKVDFGVHSFSTSGLDSQFDKDLHMKTAFCEIIGNKRNKEMPPLKEMAEKFVYEPVEAGQTSASSSLDSNKKKSALHMSFPDIKGKRSDETTSTTSLAVKPTKEVKQKDSETMSTIALVVKPTKQVKLYERYLKNGKWNDHDFTFKIAH
ncbi:hypothetical protein EUTSA_v10008393mg [Eutrema salsugineum]|uniref:Uncharacterized protein n=1 Tax=Eutrema salsugineum TaxID=72664 RepID=V4KXG7_EUTSA|nr:hypothetical protein EUTSA_v10008393mg [Eutrema salsugineum]